MTIALSTVLTGRTEERKVRKGREQCSGFCSTVTAPLDPNGYLPTAALTITGRGRWEVGEVRGVIHSRTTSPPFFLFHLIPGHS